MRDAHEFSEIYEDLGINLNSLGCLMLATENPLTGEVPLDGQYVSPDPDKFWMKGVAKDWHVTVRYGFLPGVKRQHVDAVIEGIEVPQFIATDGFEVFPSPSPDEDYECVVVRVGSARLTHMNKQLAVLPNLSTFLVYKPHITVGFFKTGWFAENREYMRGLRKDFVPALEFDYGKNLK